MNTNSNEVGGDVKTSHWIKAVLVAVVVLALLIFILSRSACTQSGQAVASAETSEQDADSSQPSSRDDSDSDSSANGDQVQEKKAESETDSVEKAGASNDAGASGSDDAASEKENPAAGGAAPDSSDTTDPVAGGGQGATADDGAGSATGKSIGGLQVKGERLGVILDVSGSMSRYLESLRAEIRSRFESPVFLEVQGCIIEPSLFDPSAIGSTSPGQPNRRASVMNAIRELVEIENVDSVYWFCDLQDARTEEGLQELESLVRANGGDDPAFHLYVRSTDEAPGPALKEIIRLSGGAFEKRR